MNKYLLSTKVRGLLFFSLLLYFSGPAVVWAGSLTLPSSCDIDSVRSQKGTSTFIYNNNGSSSSLSYNGTITFTKDERDIKSISPGGFFKYSKTTFGNSREIQILSGSDGTLRRRYFVGHTEQAYEPAGRQWLNEMLPGVIATTGIGAEDRVQRIYAKSGLNGVLEEIYKIDNDRVQTIYFSYLFNQPKLKDTDVRKVLSQVNRYIDSDYEKGKLLRKIGPRFLQSNKVTPEYLSAVTTMNSDYEKGKVLSYILQNGKINPDNYAQTISTVSRISSDYEQAKILKQVIANPALPDWAYKEVITQTIKMSSDYEKNRILILLLSKPKVVEQNFDDLLNAIRNIESDYEKSKALAYLVAKQKLSAQHYLQVFPVVTDISSSYEKSKTLQRLKTTMPTDNNEVRAAYLRTAKTIASDYEYRRVIAGM